MYYWTKIENILPGISKQSEIVKRESQNNTISDE